MICRSCGRKLPDDSVFCVYCGNKVETMQTRDTFEEKQIRRPIAKPTKPKARRADKRATHDKTAVRRVRVEYICMIAVAVCVAVVGVGSLFAVIMLGSKDDKLKTADNGVTVASKETYPDNADDADYTDSAAADSYSAVSTVSTEYAPEGVPTDDVTAESDSSPDEAAPKDSSKPQKEKPADKKKKVEIIPAVDMIDMWTDEIRDLVGDDYRASCGEYSVNGNEIYGITSDTYFPNTVLCFNEAATSEQELTSLFLSDAPVYDIYVFDGGLIGDNARVGMKYSDMLTKIDSLAGVSETGRSYSIVSNRLVDLWFDHLDEIEELFNKYGGSDNSDSLWVVDASKTNAVCTYAHFQYMIGDDAQLPAKVTADGVALRNAPYADAPTLLCINKGETIYLRGTSVDVIDGVGWYEVSRYDFYNGKRTARKMGYIHSEYVKV